MNAQVRRTMEMAAGVLGFLRAHPSEGESYRKVLNHFEELLARAEALVAQQRAGLIATRAASARRKELRHELHFKLLPHLVSVGVVAAKDRADLALQFQLPGLHATHLGFLTAAKAMLAKAEAQKDVLVSQGMSEGLLDALGKAVAEFETVNEMSRSGRRDHVGARADLDAISVQILDQVRLFDGVVRFRFGEDPELMAAWESARNVPGPFRATVVSPPAPPAGDGVVPPTSGGIAPAA